MSDNEDEVTKESSLDENHDDDEESGGDGAADDETSRRADDDNESGGSSHSLQMKILALQLQLKNKEEQMENLQTERKERVLLARGQFFAQLQDVLGTNRVAYTNGFDGICGRIRGPGDKDDAASSRWRAQRFPKYKSLELELLAKVKDTNATADDLSYVSNSASSKGSYKSRNSLSKEVRDVIEDQKENKLLRAQSSSGLSRSSGEPTDADSFAKMVDAGTVTNVAHLLAGNKTCSPTMGIFTQTIIGYDFEGEMDRQIEKAEGNSTKIALIEKRKKILQNLAFHQREYKGFCNLPNNMIAVPKGGHEKFFDTDCDWIIAPIMPFEKLIHWHHKMGGYWVMFIAGSFTKRDNQAYTNFLQASTSDKEGEHVYVKGVRERCSKPDVDQGIKNISIFIKAFADLATGRGHDKLTPFDLMDRGAEPPGLKGLKSVQRKLQNDEMVTVPILRAYDEEKTQVLKVFIDCKDLTKIPEPMAVAAKGALNLMEMNGERATPACAESSSVGEDSHVSSVDQISFRTPTASCQESSDVPDYISIVTPSP